MTTNAWAQIPLGEVVCHRKEFVRIGDTQEYMRCRVQLGARGIVLRDRVLGMGIKTKEQQVCRAGELLVAEIDAKVGGFGIVPDELDGAIVSSHYFLFSMNTNRIDRKYLGYFIKTPQFQSQITPRGSTNYAAIRPRHVLEYVIPLPNRTEQKRIAAKLDKATAKVRKARWFAQAIEDEAAALCRAIIFTDVEASAGTTELSEILRLREPDISVAPHVAYHFAGVYCFGRGVFKGPSKPGLAFSYSKLTRLRAGDFVYPKLMAWEGALAVVPPECDGLVVSPEFPVFEIDTDRVLPEVLDVYFRSPEIWPRLSGTSTGTNVRRRRLKPADFLRYRMPLLSRETQFKLRRTRKAVEELRASTNLLIAELDAMLPSVLDKAFKGEL